MFCYCMVFIFVSLCIHYVVVAALCSSCYFFTQYSLCCFVAPHSVIGIKIIKTNDERISLSINSKHETKGP